MVCPRCNGKVLVIDTVNVSSENQIYRKRACTSCGHTFFTSESIAKQDIQFLDNWNQNHR